MIDCITRNDKDWRAFYESDSPENDPIPDYEDKISDQDDGPFLHLCLIRCLREDRSVIAAIKFIQKTLSSDFIRPVSEHISEIYEASLPNRPVLYLLSTGADPTGTIDDYSRRFKKFPTKKVSMGEEMEGPALEKIKEGFRNGDWVILNNCHLSLDFMAEMETILNPKEV